MCAGFAVFWGSVIVLQVPTDTKVALVFEKVRRDAVLPCLGCCIYYTEDYSENNF